MNRLKILREEKKLKQSDIAKILHVEIAAISKYETDRVPLKEEYIKILSDFFDVSSDYLLGLTDIRISHKIGVTEVTDEMIQRDFHVGLSRAEEGSLSEDEKQQIRDFAKYVISKRKEGN